jgi:CBS domain containing-hemolysin-like protein
MREDFRLLLRESEAANILDAEAADILDRAIDFYSTRVEHLMVPLSSVHSIPANLTILEAINLCNVRKVSRVPVSLGADEDGIHPNWIGIFSVYDAFFTIAESEWTSLPVAVCMRPMITVSDDECFDIVLKKFRGRVDISPMMVVVSKKSGKQAGIVTPEDAVRRLFG